MKLKGKKIVIAGASSGIGKELAMQLDKEECRLVLIGRSQEKLQELREQLQGLSHMYLPIDITQYTDMTLLYQQITDDGLKLDGLVYSAGVGPIYPIKLLKRKNIEHVMEINVYGFIEMVRQFANNKSHNLNSSIVAISSIAAVQPEKCQTVYAMSKAALNIAVESLAIELAAKSIRINAIMPGVTRTPMAMEANRFLEGNDFIGMASERQLLGIIEPRNIADIATFLLSERSSVITGRSIYADGGRF